MCVVKPYTSEWIIQTTGTNFTHRVATILVSDLKGYFMKIGESDDKTNCGRIHVDFAEARDDLYEYQCMQRALERERRHQERLAEEMNRPPSPQKAVHYSDHEASILADTLKCTFSVASLISSNC